MRTSRSRHSRPAWPRSRTARRGLRSGSPAAGHFRYAIDTAAGSADYSLTPVARERRDPAELPGRALMQRLKAANPEPQGPDLQGPLRDGRARPVGRRLHRRRDPGRRRASRVVPAQHERPALHVPLLQLDLGRRHRQRGLPAEVGRQRARRDGRQGLGRRLHGRHQPEHGRTTTTSRASPSTRPTPPTRPRPARRSPRSAPASAPPASSSSRTSASGRTTRASSTAGCSTSTAA